MKTIGLIGGMSWESTVPYYAEINRGVAARLGGNHSAKCLLHSFDFAEIEADQYSGDWAGLEAKMIDAGLRLKSSGADFAVLCTNTMHKVVESFEAEVGMPLLHIADAVAAEVKRMGIRRVGLLGTIFTMEHDFYRGRLERLHGLEVVVPPRGAREEVNSIIYGELVKGVVRGESRARYVEAMDGLAGEGAEGIILGCTEIGLLVKDYGRPLFDSALIHARAAVEAALVGE